MNIRILSLCIVLGLSGCNSNPIMPDTASVNGLYAVPIAPVTSVPTAAAKPYVPSPPSYAYGNNPYQKSTPHSSYHQYRCADLTDAQAQALLAAGHTYLDADGDGDACEPDPRRDYSPRSTKSSSGNCHWVNGYTRKDGTKVRGHTRCR